jgi:O-antigen/teichoic acid export membrane protein
LINTANQPLLALLQADGLEHYAARVVIGSAVVGLIAIATGAYIAGAAGAAVGAVLLQLSQLLPFVWKAVHRPSESVGRSASGPATNRVLKTQLLTSDVADDPIHP